MDRADLEAAAFWGRAVCLSCGHTQEGEDDVSDSIDRLCEACDAEDVWPATFILRAADFVEGGGA